MAPVSGEVEGLLEEVGASVLHHHIKQVHHAHHLADRARL